MIYLWLKAFHIAAAMTWTGGMLVAGVAVSASATASSPGAGHLLDVVRRWDRRVTSPSMLLAWTVGIVMAVQGGWYSAPWLMTKVVVVLALSALHGMLVMALRRAAKGDGTTLSTGISYAAQLTVALTVFIIALAVVKPF